MADGPKAIERRKCAAIRKDGRPCEAWALWDDPRQLCVAHSGRHHRGPMFLKFRPYRYQKARYVPCTCAAYAWPHRPSGGLCRWPDPPIFRCLTPCGTHSWPRLRKPGWWPRRVFKIAIQFSYSLGQLSSSLVMSRSAVPVRSSVLHNRLN